MKNSILEQFFSLGSLNSRPVSPTTKVDLNKRFLGGDHVAIHVPTLSESLNGTFNSVLKIMSDGVSEVCK